MACVNRTACVSSPQISPEKMRLQSPVTRVQWAVEDQEEEAGAECPTAPPAERYPCVVEYKSKSHAVGRTAANKSGEEESGGVSTRRIRCRRVLVTVGLGVLKVGRIPSSLCVCKKGAGS